MTAFAGLALLPDADVVGLSFGLNDHGPYGHRGYSHSLLFALTIAGIAFWVARRWGTRPWFTALLAFLAVASHGVLDAMTYRTRGIPFFWPIEEMRIAFPWRPIPPAPTGIGFLSKRGLEVMAVELVYFFPLVLAAIAPSVTTMGRWLRGIVSWMRPSTEVAGAALAVPVEVARPRLGGGTRAALRLTGAVALVVATLVAAQVYLSQSRMVAWIEQTTQENLAVSLMRKPQFRHLR